MKAILTKCLVGWMALAIGQAIAADAPADIVHGKQRFDYWCATCHGPNKREGRFLPGTASLMVKYQGKKPAALEQRDDLPAAYVAYIVRHGSFGMPFFRKTEISDQDLRDIAAYLARNTK